MFCASSAVNCARLTLVFINKGIDAVNSINSFSANWNPKAPTLVKAEQIFTFMDSAAKISQAFVFPSKNFIC